MIPKKTPLSFLRVLYPRKCPCCRGVIAPDMLICPDCTDKFRAVRPPYCLKCGRHVDETAEYCNECASKDHSYTGGIAVFEYDSRMKRSMSDFKFNGWKENGEYYADEAVNRRGGDILKFAPQALIPVPVHKSKRASRGYNQAEIIAEGIGSRLNIRVVDNLLFRTRKTKAQKALGRENRGENLKIAFSCDTDAFENNIGILFPRVMLVDDIYTTGSTVEGCASALLEAGVKEVGFICIAAGGGN